MRSTSIVDAARRQHVERVIDAVLAAWRFAMENYKP